MSKTSLPPSVARSARPAIRRPEALASPALVVAHSAPDWLPVTQNWMHSQVARLPGWVEPHVICDTTQNLDCFGVPGLHALSHGSRLTRCWDRMLRKARVRHHLGHLPSIVRRTGARVLHSHFGHIGWNDHAIARRLRLAHVVTFYGQDLTYLPRHDPRWVGRYRRMFEQVAMVLCEGPHMARQVEALGCRADRVRVQHLGVDLQAIRFQPRIFDPAAGEPLRVLIAGTFTEKKGIPDAIRALAITRQHVPLEISIVGDAAKDNARHAAEKEAILSALHRTGLLPHVRLLGFRSHGELMALAYAHHLLLSPSRHAADGDSEGGAPVTVLELAASGMPVVSTKHCDIPAIIVDEVGGLLADEGDIDGLAERVLRLARSPQTWVDMVRAARQHCERGYDVRRQGEALAQIYAEVAGVAPGAVTGSRT